MKRDPKGRWNSQPHPFLCQVNEAYSFAGVTAGERQMWKKEVSQNWVSLNFNGLPIDEIKNHYEDVMVDSRTMLTVVNHLAHQQQHSNHLIYRLIESNETLVSKHETLVSEVRLCCAEIKSLKEEIRTGSNMGVATAFPLDEMNAGDTLPNIQEANIMVPTWGHVKTCLGKTTGPDEKFIVWHLKQGSLSYELWKGTQDGKLPEAMVRFHHAMKKFCVNMMHYADEVVPGRPMSDCYALANWENIVRGIAVRGLAAAKLVLDKATYTDIRDKKIDM
jgi:hypothetical protein